MNVKRYIVAVFHLAWLTLFTEGALAAPPTIDCDRTSNDQAILQGAVNLALKGATIRVKGTCEGIGLEITKAGITLAGPAELVGKGDNNVVFVRESDGVTLRDLTISGGKIGLASDRSRVTAFNVVAEHNSVYGIWSVGNGYLACVNCEGNSNGTGLLTTDYLSLCGNTQFNDNVNDGMFGFMGARIFSLKSTCGDRPTITMRGNGLGLHLYGNTSMFVQEGDVDTSQNRTFGVLAFDNVVVSLNQANLVVSNNQGTGFATGASSTARLNDTGGGTTTIANNAGIGLYLIQNSEVEARDITVSANGNLDILVFDFSVANFIGTFSRGNVSCEPGQSSGTVCPP